MANTYGSPRWAVGSRWVENTKTSPSVSLGGKKGQVISIDAAHFCAGVFPLLGMTNRLFVQRGSREGAPAPPEPAYQWIPDWDSENAYEIDMWINVFSGCQCTKHDVLFEGFVSGWYLVGDGRARNRMM